eukprot:2368897-Amphidinium_carterae.1
MGLPLRERAQVSLPDLMSGKRLRCDDLICDSPSICTAIIAKKAANGDVALRGLCGRRPKASTRHCLIGVIGVAHYVCCVHQQGHDTCWTYAALQKD